MKALILDYMCWDGHKMFDSIHIDALNRIGCQMVLVGRKGYFDQMSIDKAEEVFYLPEEYFKSHKNNLVTKITFRLNDLHKLHLVEQHLDLADFDFIFVPTYDIATLTLFSAPCPICVYDHSTGQFSNNIKRILQKWGKNKDTIHLAPTISSYEFIKKNINNKHTYLLPHGLCRPYPTGIANTGHEPYIFCPISATSQCDNTLVESILQSETVLDYLKKSGISIVIKDTEKTTVETNLNHKQIIRIEGYLETQEYRKWILHSLAVFLPYDTTFRNRVSGIFHECISNTIPVITSKIATFDIYDDIINYPFRINTPESFVTSIEAIRHTTNPYTHIQRLQPDMAWQQLIHNL